MRPIPASPIPLPGLLALGLLACGAPPAPEPPFTLELLGTPSLASFDSLPEPRLEVSDGRVVIHGDFGLGGTGYRLAPFGTIEEGVVDILVSAETPKDLAGLTVLTDYQYVLTTSVLAPGTWKVRLHHVIAEEGDPEFMLEQEVVVPR